MLKSNDSGVQISPRIKEQSLAKPPILLSSQNSITNLLKSTVNIFSPAPVKYNVNDFEIIRTLGTGSFGRVHLVKNRKTNEYQALKALQKEAIIRQKQVQHTINEKEIMAQVNCPFIVNHLGSFQDKNHVFFVMEYVAGGELFSLIRKYRCLPDPVAKFYSAQVVLALEYLHSKDIVYRDLKPENLLLDAQGNIKLTDFGFAKHVPDVTWTLCGTPDYLAPEIIRSKAYGKAVDWWSLGILIYEMLVGNPPFYDESPLKLYEKILACKLRFPSNMDPAARDLIKCLLQPDLTKRYGNLKGGVGDIKKHAWFSGVDWEMLWNRQIATPYKPPLQHPGDSAMFDKYDENFAQYGVLDGSPDGYGNLFTKF